MSRVTIKHTCENLASNPETIWRVSTSWLDVLAFSHSVSANQEAKLANSDSGIGQFAS